MWIRAHNSIIYGNTAPIYSNAYERCMYTCNSPFLPGAGNISVDPKLLGEHQLSGASLCIGAGNADYVTDTDLDGLGDAELAVLSERYEDGKAQVVIRDTVSGVTVNKVPVP